MFSRILNRTAPLVSPRVAKMATATTISPFPAKQTAMDIFHNSCYYKIDYKINENATAHESAIRFTAFNISCLVVTDDQDKLVGVVSGRDYINKVAANGRDPLVTKIKDICTYGPKIIVARESDSLEACMNKMMFKGIRHLIVMDDQNTHCVGLISIRDLVKEVIQNQRETITRLSDFKLGKGAFFGSE